MDVAVRIAMPTEVFPDGENNERFRKSVRHGGIILKPMMKLGVLGMRSIAWRMMFGINIPSSRRPGLTSHHKRSVC